MDVIEEKNKFEGNKEKRFWRKKRWMGREKGKKVWEKTRCEKKFSLQKHTDLEIIIIFYW